MTKIVLEIPNQDDVELIVNFAKRLQANVIQVDKDKDKSAIYWLEILANSVPFEDIADPSEWQRSQRKERKLPFRNNILQINF